MTVPAFAIPVRMFQLKTDVYEELVMHVYIYVQLRTHCMLCYILNKQQQYSVWSTLSCSLCVLYSMPFKDL